MQLDISTRHGHLSEASQDKLKSRAEKLGRFFDRLTAIEIVVDLKDEKNPKVDVKASAEHKHDFVAHEQSNNMMKACESAFQKIEQQLRKYKERLQEKSRNPQARREELTPAEPEGDDS